MTSNEEKGDIEEHWIQRVQRGDEEAFEEMFKEYYKVLTRFSWRYVNSKAIAEELVQEVLVAFGRTANTGIRMVHFVLTCSRR
jgi:DNA-directed RNA polymerase specialized sigma24 family protein